MLNLPTKLRRVFKGGWMDGEKYEQPATSQNFEIKFLAVREQAGGPLSGVFRLVDRQLEGETEIQTFEFDRLLPHDEAGAFIAIETAHARN